MIPHYLKLPDFVLLLGLFYIGFRDDNCYLIQVFEV